MRTFNYVITDELGMHARPAGGLVKEASQFLADIMIRKGDRQVNAKRLLSVMGLAIKKGEEICITADGEDEAEALIAIETYLRKNL
jgi:phosphocarrier protein